MAVAVVVAEMLGQQAVNRHLEIVVRLRLAPTKDKTAPTNMLATTVAAAVVVVVAGVVAMAV